MTRLKPKPRRASPEHDLHRTVAEYLAAALRPPVFWTSVDAGAGKLSPRSAAMMKARGVKRGIPDILIFAREQDADARLIVIGIELKAPIGRLSDTQLAAHEALGMLGVHCRVARSVEQVQDILRVNGIPLHARVTA